MNRAYDFGAQRRLHRSRSGIIFGVFKGLADYCNFSLFWTRAIGVVTILLTGFWPGLGLYLLAAVLMKPEPVCREKAGRGGFHNQRHDQRMDEAAARAREYDWDRRFNQA